VTILLVDDDPDIRLIAAVALRRLAGAVVVEAASAAEALRLAGTERPDAVIADVGLGDADGEALLRALRALPGTAAVPVVFLTGSTDAATRERLLAAGAREVLHKPFAPAAFAAEVARLLEA
jgi:CheY-like chemotaxis protein